MARPQLRIENHGSVALLRPLNPEAQAWLDENVETEGWQYFGDALACEPRYVSWVAHGFVADGGEIL